MCKRVNFNKHLRRLKLFCSQNNSGKNIFKSGEKGAALVTTLLILMLLLAFVALALSRTSADNLAASNDAAEADAFGASQAGLEDATREFASVLQQKLNPSDGDLSRIKTSTVDGFSDKYTYTKNLETISDAKKVIQTSKEYQGLYSLRDEWQIDVTAKEKNTDAEVHLMRRFYNNRIPLFQFGAFYNDDLELNRPPLFTFGGRVHTNGNLFVSSFAGQGIYFKSKITAAGEIVNDIWKTSVKLVDGTDNKGDVFVVNTADTMNELETSKGSVTCSTDSGAGVLLDPQKRGFPYPKCVKNTGWSTYSTSRFEGNLQANAAELKLPIDKLGFDLIEMIRRGKNVKDKANIGGSITSVTDSKKDDPILSKERFANKPGLRISLADEKDELPQCVGVDPCGVQLDQDVDGSAGNSIGYQPKSMLPLNSYKTTALNANRLVPNGRDVWIKIELVKFDNNKNEPVVEDVTEDFLSLGVTDEIGRRDPLSNYSLSNSDFRIPSYPSDQDSRSIIKLQRFYIENTNSTSFPSSSYITNEKPSSYTYSFPARRKDLTYQLKSGKNLTNTFIDDKLNGCKDILGIAFYNLLPSLPADTGTGSNRIRFYYECNSIDEDAFAAPVFNSFTPAPTFNTDESYHYETAFINSKLYRVVPFPIQMYDAREGNRCDGNGDGNCDSVDSDELYRNGVMSLVDIDVYNLRRFFRGDFNSNMPTDTLYAKAHGNVGLKNTDVPESRGWVVYFSDRRGDNNFDGRYDMEEVDPDNGTQLAQDLNKNNNIGKPSTSSTAPQENKDAYQEAPFPIDAGVEMGLAAVTDHQYYRRGLRLINARDLPGSYDPAKPGDTQGVTFSSENGIYVKGNYNVQSVSLPTDGTVVAESSRYSPQNSIPSAIIGDSVTVLSNSWSDANSFVYPFDQSKRAASATQVRFAMISGDSQTYKPANSQGTGSFVGLNGGIHNFKRFLEIWTDKRLNYAGSLINLYNAYNSNGRWKCCNSVYNPPIRDWTFDETFTDPDRLPPGSPYVYYMTFTGFQRINE